MLVRLRRDSACAVAMVMDGITRFDLMPANVTAFEALATRRWRYPVTIELSALMLYNNG